MGPTPFLGEEIEAKRSHFAKVKRFLKAKERKGPSVQQGQNNQLR